MVKVPENIRDIVQEYLKDLSSEIKIDKAILFGSYAKGNYNVDSDIDLAIFSDLFRNMDRIESIKYLLKKARYKGHNQRTYIPLSTDLPIIFTYCSLFTSVAPSIN